MERGSREIRQRSVGVKLVFMKIWHGRKTADLHNLEATRLFLYWWKPLAKRGNQSFATRPVRKEFLESASLLHATLSDIPSQDGELTGRHVAYQIYVCFSTAVTEAEPSV